MSTHTEAKHTPGPWEVAVFDGPRQYAEITAGDGVQDLVRICDIPSWPCATDEMEANARLIAAAPELLAALEAMLKVALKCDDKVWAMAVERADETRPCDMALDAIAKAKGGA